MSKQRYSVYGTKGEAERYGPDWETWKRAKADLDDLNDRDYRIWRHNDNGTVTDVTDGDVESKWFICSWNKKGGYEARLAGIYSRHIGISWDDGEVVEGTCCIRSTYGPSAAEFQAHVLAETGVTVPCVEEPRWWEWHGLTDTWAECRADSPTVEFGQYADGTVWGVTVYGTVSNRDEKRDALLGAAKFAGKPEDER